MVPTFHYSITNTILDINDWNRISVNIKKKKIIFRTEFIFT